METEVLPEEQDQGEVEAEIHEQVEEVQVLGKLRSMEHNTSNICRCPNPKPLPANAQGRLHVRIT